MDVILQWEYIIILILIIVIIWFGLSCFLNIMSFLLDHCTHIEPMVDIPKVTREVKWAKDKTCKYSMVQAITDIFNENNIPETQDDDWVIYLPCTYNDIQGEINKINPTKADQRIFII